MERNMLREVPKYLLTAFIGIAVLLLVAWLF